MTAARAAISEIPVGQRVYAVGDVHGRLDLLTKLVSLIEDDNRDRPEAAMTLILLGDLVDRGPESAGVVRFIRRLAETAPYLVRLIKGNHEEVFVLAAQGNARAARVLMKIGGDATLRDFGIGDEEAAQGSFADLAKLLRQRIPREDVVFLDSGEDLIEIGDYIFVHAGIRPGVGLRDQSPADLRWIRDEFLSHAGDHGRMVVHGHTVFNAVNEQANRIGVDTGAFASGLLSAIGLEGDKRWFLQARNNDQSIKSPSALR